MFIFKYIKKSDGSLLGYHLDTSGQLGSKENAKKYGREVDTPESMESQKNTLQRNLETRLDRELNPESRWDMNIFVPIRAQYQNLKSAEVELVMEEVPYQEQVLVVHTTIDLAGNITKH